MNFLTGWAAAVILTLAIAEYFDLGLFWTCFIGLVLGYVMGSIFMGDTK